MNVQLVNRCAYATRLLKVLAAVALMLSTVMPFGAAQAQIPGERWRVDNMWGNTCIPESEAMSRCATYWQSVGVTGAYCVPTQNWRCPARC